ncbi:MAG: TetR/AcrR family transcriptional regulator [Bacteroidetes bacterium]|nr:TetR/AcrR family transcriptional regulator [Bacteroidota bacterium]
MENKNKIIERALYLFTEYGIKGTTMDNIAVEVGISKRTLYENFSDKKTLITECVKYIINMHMEMEEELKNQNLSVIDEIFFKFKHLDEKFFNLSKLGLEIKRIFPDIFKEYAVPYHEKAHKNFTNWFKRGINEGLIIEYIDAELSIFMLNEAMYNLVFKKERITATNLSLIDSFKYVSVFFFRGIATDKGIKMIDEYIKNYMNNNKIV